MIGKYCNHNGKLFLGNKRCFEYISPKKSWPYARSECSRRSGHLAVIKDQATQDFINKTFPHDSDVWIGGYKKKRWYWEDSEYY